MMSRARTLLLACAATTVGGVAASGGSPLSIGLPFAFLTLLADGVLRADSNVLAPIRRHGPRGGTRVALTFDDGPDPEVTPRVLDALAQDGAHATFFTIGRALEAHPDLARRLVAEGHELGNHSWRHARWDSFQPSIALHGREIDRGEQAIAAVTGRRARPPYRPPFGVKSPPFLAAAEQRDLELVAWSLHSGDTRLSDPDRIVARVLSRVRGGDIVLMHDGHDLPGRHRLACAEALPRILVGLRERGLESVTVSELLQPGKRSEPVPRHGRAEIDTA
jgi:peptidoglycan/xylan/chitin deacetylase (PgdA/CDA1 family)